MSYNFELHQFSRNIAKATKPNSNARPPDLSGAYTIEGQPAVTITGAWIETAASGLPYIKGKLVAPTNFTDKVLGQRASADPDSPVPPVKNLDKGELLLFKNDKATAENRQPNWRGYAHQWDGSHVELAAWDRPRGVEGTAKPYRPGTNVRSDQGPSSASQPAQGASAEVFLLESSGAPRQGRNPAMGDGQADPAASNLGKFTR